MANGGQTAAGVTVPDTKLAREATELVREVVVLSTCHRVEVYAAVSGPAGRVTGEPRPVRSRRIDNCDEVGRPLSEAQMRRVLDDRQL